MIRDVLEAGLRGDVPLWLAVAAMALKCAPSGRALGVLRRILAAK